MLSGAIHLQRRSAILAAKMPERSRVLLYDNTRARGLGGGISISGGGFYTSASGRARARAGAGRRELPQRRLLPAPRPGHRRRPHEQDRPFCCCCCTEGHSLRGVMESLVGQGAVDNDLILVFPALSFVKIVSGTLEIHVRGPSCCAHFFGIFSHMTGQLLTVPPIERKPEGISFSFFLCEDSSSAMLMMFCLFYSIWQVPMKITPEDFLLAEGERCQSLEEYRKDCLPENLLVEQLPPGQDPGVYPACLCRGAQRLFYLCISMVDRLVMLRHLPASLSKEDIVLTLPYHLPKLRVSRLVEDPVDNVPKMTLVHLVKDPTEQDVTKIVQQLGAIFEDLIRVNDETITIPSEVYSLLYLMKSKSPRTASPDLPLMKVATCLIPMENRGELFVRAFQYVFDVLRVFEPKSYRYIMIEVLLHNNWQQRGAQNLYVYGLMMRGHYNFSSPAENLKLNRHGPCHALHDAADRTAPYGLGYKSSDLNHALYLASDMQLATLLNALHYIGRLGALRAQSLFPWSADEGSYK